MNNKKTLFVSDDDSYDKLFSEIRNELLKVDPVSFAETYLKLDGKPFKISGNGWKFLADVYRYIALKAINPDGKPVVIVKGRQVGATVMASVLDLYFTASGLFGVGDKPPMTVLHCFPQLSMAQRFSQSKLESLISNATNDYVNQQKLGYNAKTKKVSSNKPDNMTLKQFKGNCNLWIESLGGDGDRIRGISVDVINFDECFPYEQRIQTENGKMKIGDIYNKFTMGKKLPLIKTFNEKNETFEYKQITNVWNRGEREILQINCGHWRVKCTPNHRFLTDDGWKEAANLKIGELIKTSPATDLHIRALNDDQLQIVLGSFLGDGHLSHYNNNRYRLRVIHSIKQEEYCKWKAHMFNVNCKYIEKNGFAQTPAISFCSKTFALNNEIPQNKETCTKWILDKIDARGLAVWFMDDASTQINKSNEIMSTIFSTCSFDEASQQLIVDKLKSFGIDSKYYLYYSKCRNKHYYSIILNKENSYKFINLVKPYIHQNIYYKLSKLPITLNSYVWNNAIKSYGYQVIDDIVYLNKKEEVFDIEVQHNHNFIIASSSRGKYLKLNGGIIAHNCQDMSPTAVGVALKTLTQAKYGPPGTGIQVYFGTPKNKGSYFEVGLWNQTDKRYYFLGCTNEECKQYFMLSTPGSEDWQKIWLFGQTIKCPECGHEEDKRILIENGKWMPTEPYDRDGKPKKFVGYHISQLYVPTLDKNYILNQHPKNNPASSERIYYNEALGEFYSGSDMPITKDEIYEKCRDPDRSFSRYIPPNEKKVWMGVDWGGKVDTNNSSAGQSFSCVVVLTADAQGTLNVEFAYKMRSTDLQYKISFVKEMYKNYNLSLAVADYGFGHDICNELQKIYGTKFITALTSGNLKKNVSYNKDMLQMVWNKDYFIEEMFDLMRKGKIKFPWKSFEKIDWLIDHITSMEVVHTMSQGLPKKSYKKGPTPNDGFMALIYAYLAYKFEITKSFSINNNNLTDSGMPRPKLAYLPRLK